MYNAKGIVYLLGFFTIVTIPYPIIAVMLDINSIKRYSGMLRSGTIAHSSLISPPPICIRFNDINISIIILTDRNLIIESTISLEHIEYIKHNTNNINIEISSILRCCISLYEHIYNIPNILHSIILSKPIGSKSIIGMVIATEKINSHTVLSFLVMQYIMLINRVIIGYTIFAIGIDISSLKFDI